MDPENQDRIMALVDTLGADDLVVVLGAADPEALEVAAETVTAGDPSYVGPLAGVSLGLPVVHIFEDEVKEQVDARWAELGLPAHADAGTVQNGRGGSGRRTRGWPVRR